ncbi:MAG: hypothetical protein AAF191_02605, partial [Verrucomicrobiota bacterium]
GDSWVAQLDEGCYDYLEMLKHPESLHLVELTVLKVVDKAHQNVVHSPLKTLRRMQKVLAALKA